ncbi:MAG: nodulation protein NfeD [Bacteroidetes bacterium]|nr:nodulation protein NfeD [Bacteroidota bacterium]
MTKKYLIAFILLFPFIVFSQSKKIYLLTIDGAINPASTEYIQEGIKAAVDDDAECVIIKLNTPGGLLKSTRVIVTEFLQAKIPIVVYVHPQGSQAASAGVFVTMAAHIAAMAPGTNIGAAHPVSLEGQQDSIMMEKATNDAAAFIRTISEKRNRNIEWGEDAVRKSLSITETEALKKNVIDIVATSVDDLIQKLDGRKVETIEGEKEINSVGAEIIPYDMSFKHKLLNTLSDPNIAYILFMLGLYGLLFELYNPGSIFPGVVGGICIILAFYSFHTLPINYAGLALIIFAIILFILEIKVVSHGILTIGGTISLILGSIMLIDSDSTLEFVKISWQIIALFVVLTVVFFVFAIGLGIKAQRKKATTGIEGLLLEEGFVVSDLKPIGTIQIHGEIWNAESVEGKISKGHRVKVLEVNNLTLKVRKV